MANIAITDIHLDDPQPEEVLKIVKQLQEEYPYLTATIVNDEYVCIDTKWRPATDLALEVFARLKANGTIVWSELGNLGVGALYVQYVDEVLRASQQFTHDTPTNQADIDYIVRTEPLLANHVEWYEVDDE